MMLPRDRPEIDQPNRLDTLGFDFVDGPDAYGLGRQFLVDRVKALIPMPLVGFKLALLVVVEIEQELRVFVLRGGFGHPRFLRFQNRSHGSCLLLRPLGQRETGAFGEFPPTFPQVWEQLRVVVDALGEEGWHTGMAVRPGLLLPGRIQLPLHRAASAVCSRIAYSDQKRPWCSYLLPAGEGAPQGRMRAELRALARKSPHPAVPATFSPREKERRPRRACNPTVKRAGEPGGLSCVPWPANPLIRPFRPPSPRGRRRGGPAAPATQRQNALDCSSQTASCGAKNALASGANWSPSLH